LQLCGVLTWECEHEIEAIEQRAREPFVVTVESLRRAGATRGRIATTAARAGVRQ
jgi:hypothetical protein